MLQVAKLILICINLRHFDRERKILLELTSMWNPKRKKSNADHEGGREQKDGGQRVKTFFCVE